MKKFLSLLVLLVIAKLGFSQNLVDTVGFQGVLVPQYMASGNSSRLPVVFRAKVTNLAPNTTYRYYTSLARYSDLGTTSAGAGNTLFISGGSWRYAAPGSLTTAGGYDVFATDINGEFEGWFAVVNTGNARFTAGNYVKPVISIGDLTGTTLKKWAMGDSIQVLAFATGSGSTDGTGIYGYSMAPAKEIIALYELSTDTRPAAVTFTESAAIGGSNFASLAAFYTDSVRTKLGAWGTIIRNANSNGIQKIERRAWADNSVKAFHTDNDGVWPSSVDTRNASAGITGLLISSSDAPLTAPTISVNTSGFLGDFGVTSPGNPTSGSNFMFSASDLSDSLSISINAPFEVRIGVNAYSSNTLKLNHSNGVVSGTVLDVRFNPTTTGVFTDTIYISSPGATTQKIFVKGTSSLTPEISFHNATATLGENGGSVNVRVNISNPNNVATTVQLTVLGGTATAGSDYTFTSPQTLTFPANSSDSIVVNIPVIDDILIESNETILLGFANYTNGSIAGAIDSFTVTINDNDFRKVDIDDIKGVNANGVLDSLNKRYEISGVVCGGNIRNTTQSGFQFTVLDNSGGIAIFSPGATFGYTVNQGDSLTIKGQLTTFNGLAEIGFLDTIIFHASAKPLPQPQVVANVDESTESELVRINGVTAKTSVWISGNQYVYKSNGDSILVRIANNVNPLIGVTVPSGKFDIIGIGSQFDASSPYTSGYQIFPRGTNDVIAAPDSLSAFSLLTPASGSTVTIQGAATQTLNFTWDPSQPAPGLVPANYTVLIDLPGGGFTTPLGSFTSNVGGTATALSLPYNQIISLMNTQGITVGQSISLEWTVEALTSNNHTRRASQPFAITLERDRMNGLNEAGNNLLTIYPNPAAGFVYIEMPETISNVYIHTIEGKQALAATQVGAGNTRVAVDGLENGIYIVTVETAGGVYTQRLAIQR